MIVSIERKEDITQKIVICCQFVYTYLDEYIHTQHQTSFVQQTSYSSYPFKVSMEANDGAQDRNEVKSLGKWIPWISWPRSCISLSLILISMKNYSSSTFAVQITHFGLAVCCKLVMFCEEVVTIGTTVKLVNSYTPSVLCFCVY